jgi:hypothetical protein
VSESLITGQGRTFTFQFVGAAKGKALLRLKYHRVWEHQASQDGFEPTIIVQSAGTFIEDLRVRALHVPVLCLDGLQQSLLMNLASIAMMLTCL